MSDICAEAGVSRGTLYRYFGGKDEVLEAISSHVEQAFRQAIVRAVTGRPALADRIEVVLDAIAHQGITNPASIQIIEVEPGFALDFLRREFSHHRQIVADALSPLTSELACVRSGEITELQFAEMVLRLGQSAYLVPSEIGRALPAWAPVLLGLVAASDAAPSTAAHRDLSGRK